MDTGYDDEQVPRFLVRVILLVKSLDYSVVVVIEYAY